MPAGLLARERLDRKYACIDADGDEARGKEDETEIAEDGCRLDTKADSFETSRMPRRLPTFSTWIAVDMGSPRYFTAFRRTVVSLGVST